MNSPTSNLSSQPSAPSSPSSSASPLPVPLAHRGKPTKCTPHNRAALLAQLARGLNYTQACQVIGISTETLRTWRRDDPSLSDAIMAAESEAAGSRLDIITNASQKNWRAAAWWLERKFPHIWGQTRNLTVEDKLGYARVDRSATHEHELSPLEIDLRTALFLPPNAPEEDVRNALERAKINLLRSRAYGIPIDQLPQ